MYQTQDIKFFYFEIHLFVSFFSYIFSTFMKKKDFQSYQVKVKNDDRGEHTQKLRGPILCFTIDIYRLTSKFAAF